MATPTAKADNTKFGLSKVVLIAALMLVVWNIYKGATVQEIGIPGLTVRFGSHRDIGAEALNGSWRYDMRSSVTGNPYSGSLDLTVSGERVSGTMDSPDRNAEKTSIDGTFVNGTLRLLRPTNQDGVMQEYHLQKQGDHFVGTFQNVGQTSQRYRDSGTLQFHR
jgi:hypothetical protein